MELSLTQGGTVERTRDTAPERVVENLGQVDHKEHPENEGKHQQFDRGFPTPTRRSYMPPGGRLAHC
jgi:hypothetical protein